MAPELEESLSLPVLPLRDVVVFPHMVIPLFVGRKRSIKALETAMSADKQVLLLTQRDATEDEPKAKDLFEVGTIATILQLLKLPDGTVKVLVEGVSRGQVGKLTKRARFYVADVEAIEDAGLVGADADIIVRSLLTQFDQYIKLNKKVPPEILTSLAGIDDPIRLIDAIAAHMTLKVEDKQSLLEMSDLTERFEKLMALLENEIDLLQVEKKIRGRVKKQMEKGQREYYLKEQMQAIQRELGELEDVPNEMEMLEEKIKTSGMSKEAMQKATSELNKLKMMPAMSAEATVSRNYVEWLTNVPWKKRSRANYKLKDAEDILNLEHYGLEKVKERIVEYLAVQKRVKKLKGPILCLVGPPGVGKTSLGQSIAKSINRQFVRMSLGGVRDEAEIRGHRRTYIGALPGKIMQKMSKAGVRNPLFLLDEVDKMAMDFRGDPASALLEVLDPEQNDTFNDHFLEVDYDLSEVMFIATANSMEIPGPLLDRMEVIRLPGYTEHEKMHIAQEHLREKQFEANGIKEGELKVCDSAIRSIIRYYTREAGVRGLERNLAKLCRKTVRDIIDGNSKPGVTITSKNIEKYLGVKKYRYGLAEADNQVGQVKGLAWTEVGGELLDIEAACVPGKGKTIQTGQLGDVMQESIQAAMTVVRSRYAQLGIHPKTFEERDVHVHVPEGATPKDGPSAGIGMCTALVSSLTDIPVRADVAMTGEITLRGEVFPIGGLKEKLLAAARGGINIVIIPEENERDLKEIPKDILKDLEIRPVKWIDAVLDIALERAPEPLEGEALDEASALPTTLPRTTKKKRARSRQKH